MRLLDKLGPFDQPLPMYQEAFIQPRVSLTSDVLDYLQCKRKYGLYKVRGFAAAASTGEFVGTLAHRTMQRLWEFYRANRTPPQDERVCEFLETGRRELVEGENIRPHSWQAVGLVGMQVLRLNRTLVDLVGYDNLLDAERTLRIDMGQFVIEGVIDVVVRGRSGLELWDYKASKDPRHVLGDPEATARERNAARRRLERSSLQLQLYQYLFTSCTGERVTSCGVLFLGEVPTPPPPRRISSAELLAMWSGYHPEAIGRSERGSRTDSQEEPGVTRVMYSVPIDNESVSRTVKSFTAVAREILTSRLDDHWPAPPVDSLPDEQTCDDCDFRVSCPAVGSVSNRSEESGL